MKKMLIVWVMLVSTLAFAQNKVDDERMQRDIEVAENILSTLIKQQMGKRNFFPYEVEGSYLPGYGVTFRLPNSEFLGNFVWVTGSDNYAVDFPPEPMIAGDAPRPMKSYSYSYSTNEDRARQDMKRSSGKARTKVAGRAETANSDSSRNAFNENIIAAAKNFIADYGDLLTQLQPNEKIIVTNRGENRNFAMVWKMAGNNERRQTVISVEGSKADVNQFRQGKLTRDQLMSKIHVVNSEVSDELQPDLELLSSIFNRLYSRDLSKTFFSDENIYYEKLKDYGAVYHMQVFASNQIDGFEAIYTMPTLHLDEVDQETRDKKVKELYPVFEKNIKEDFLEYGRTVKSLKDNETLTFDITMTRCRGCDIPSSLELSVPNSVLKDYSSGKITKDAALAKINMKKGPNQ
ncbi:MAG TPA: hypothetical protein VL728_11310 [Cyclobacteriaceae bacterium]|nr:hypothetical protein [Cyclobacteriaceae bacterium]